MSRKKDFYMNKVFDKYADYYDIFYENKDYKAESNYLIAILKKLDINSNKILEYGCGTGIHGRLLANEGYQVFGIEQSSKMISKCKKIPGFSFVEGDVRLLRLNKKFDFVISVFHVFSYMQSNDSCNLFFQSSNKHLKIGGKLIFDFWYSPAVFMQKFKSKIRKVKKKDLVITRTSETVFNFNDNIVDVKYKIKVLNSLTKKEKIFKEVHSMRHFSLPEIKSFALNNGFKFIKAEEYLTSRPPSEDSFSVIVILEKIK